MYHFNTVIDNNIFYLILFAFCYDCYDYKYLIVNINWLKHLFVCFILVFWALFEY